MQISLKDKENFRLITQKYSEVALLDSHKKTMEGWKKLNSLNPVRPMIMIDQIPWHEMNGTDELTLHCENEFLRSLEWDMRTKLYKWKHFPCDMAFYPFLSVPKVYTNTGIGIETHIEENNFQHINAQVHTYADQIPDEKALNQLHTANITYNKFASEVKEQQVNDLVGDILPVKMTGISIWAAVWDRIVFWRGASAVLYDLIDRPDFLHKIMRKLVDIEMNQLDQLEDQNLLEYEPDTIHCSGAYSFELQGTDIDSNHIKAKNCWAAGAAQIFSEVSPQMHDEFEIEYMKPYYERFGLVNYGCCEPLHHKIDIIRKIKNVRLISISPWANVEIAAENIGRDFVMARKPNPSFLAMDSLNEKLIIEETKATLRACVKSGTPCAFILKDITTIKNEPYRLKKWFEIVKTTIDNF